MFKKIFIKTFVSAIIIASASFMIVSCQKEAVILPNEQVETLALQQKSKNNIYEPNAKPGTCTPTASVLGYIALPSALSAKTCLAWPICNGNLTSTTIQNIGPLQSNGNALIYSSTIVSVADQKAFIEDAKVKAAQNAPAGYYVAQINYYYSIWVSEPPTAASIFIKVTYSKCIPLPQG